MRKIFLILTLFCMSIALNAQYVSLSAGPVFTKMRYTTFDYFAESYNRFHAGNLSQELKPFNFASGKYIAFSFGSGPIGLDISYNNFREKTKAIFNSGESRIFDLRTGYFDMLLNVGAGDGAAGIWATAGFTIGRVNLFSYTEYSDGVVNYNLSQILNGQYTGFYVAGIIGLKGQIPITDKFAVQLRIEKLFKQPNYMGFKLNDVSNSKEGTGSDTDALPTDYFHYNEIMATQNIMPEQYNVLPDIAGIRFSIGLSLLIGN